MAFGHVFRNRYSIKRGYRSNYKPVYYRDNRCNFLYQQDAYDLAYFLAERSEAKYVIDIGGGNGEKLLKFKDKFQIIIVDFGDNLQDAARCLKKCTTINHNIEDGLPEISQEIIENSVILFCDVIEHIVKPNKLLKDISRVSSSCKFLIITTPDRVRARGTGDYGPPANPCHVREWSIDEFENLLRSYKLSPFMLGYTINTSYHLWKNNIIAVSGKLCSVNLLYKVKVLAIINVYNEADIIEEVIKHLLLEGVDVKVVDNWSNDGSYEIVQKISKTESRLTVERFPDKPNDYYEWKKLLENVENIAKKSDYDWIIHNDADEIRVSPWRDISLTEAISFVDSMGYSAIDYTVIDFKITDENLIPENVEGGLRYFEFGKRSGHFVQIKSWKNVHNMELDLKTSGGHEAIFKDRRIFPIKFLLKHYPLRSIGQAKKKVYNYRLKRYLPEERSAGWHTQYDKFEQEKSFTVDNSNLINWNKFHFESEYLVERISGIGIIRST